MKYSLTNAIQRLICPENERAIDGGGGRQQLSVKLVD
jgi:hypothetical protein